MENTNKNNSPTADRELSITRLMNAPIDKVWKVLTDKDEMKKWYFDLEEFKPEVGFRFSFTGTGKDGAKTFIHRCEIIEVIPEKKLSHTWVYEGYPGSSVVTFELFPEEGKTRLQLTHIGLGTFPQETGDFALENFEEGWTMIIGTSLAEYLEKQVISL